MAIGTEESATLPPAGADSTAPASTKLDTPAIPLKKRPPPEKPQETRTRAIVVFSFWAVVVFLGLPTWLWTTSIHRAHLPLQEMLDWSDGKTCRLTFPLQINLDAPSLQHSDAQHLLQATQHAIDDSNEFSAHHLRLGLGQHADNKVKDSGDNTEYEPALRIHLVSKEDLATPTIELRPHSTVLVVSCARSHLPSTSSGPSNLASSMAEKLKEIYNEEQAGVAEILTSRYGSSYGQQSASAGPYTTHSSNAGSNSEQTSISSSVVSSEMAAKLARRRTRSFKYASTYHVSISLMTPTAVPSSWDIDAAVSEHLLPLLDSFSISNFTIDTQIQLYSTFSPSMQSPTFSSTTNQWILSPSSLGSFINAAEWPLGPSIGSGPTINFLLYVPDPSMTPLVVGDESSATSWLIPQWGAVSILNLPQNTTDTGNNATQVPTHLPSSLLSAPLQTFSTLLLSLLSFPDSPSASFPLRLSSLTRIQSASLFFSASSTLGALARLAESLPSIPIPESVAEGVHDTITHLDATCNLLREGGRGREALEHARIAEEIAERVFFEKSMVGQVYFPDQHKVAVYLPLLGPVGVPLVTSLLRVVREWRKRRREGV